MRDLTGKPLGKYYISGKLGKGGMAEVYQAYQTGLARYVAIKVIHSHLADDPDFIERFEREALTVAQLRHPNIVQIYDFDLAEEMYYMVMEFIDGPTLEQELEARREKGEPFGLDEIVRILTPLGSAIDYAHQRGMVHRDLKPANVMFNAAGEVILTDFGIARLLASSGFTRTGVVTGTPAYMSPEQASGEAVDGRSDLYSLGVMLYELTVGRLPFEGSNSVMVMMRHMTELPPSPRRLNPTVSVDLEAVVLRSLEKAPGDRYQRAGDLIDALRQAAGMELVDLLKALPTAPASPVTLKTTGPGVTGAPVSTAPFSAPPEPARPTDVTHFVGREKELAHFAGQLRQEGLAIISGMAGVGKTALTAALAQVWQGWQMEAAPPEKAEDLNVILEKQTAAQGKVFWHTFLHGEGMMALVWKIAGFLAWHEQTELWQMLQSSQQQGSDLPPTETLLDYLFQQLRNQNMLLCLDDEHLLSDDPHYKAFTTRLQNAIAGKELTVIIASRRRPDFIRGMELTPLTGLSAADTARLAAERGLSLTPEQVDFLHQRTEGNAELLVLAVNALQRTNRPQQVLERLAETEDIERYLIAEVDSTLDDEEREVMEAVAILLGYPGSRAAIETTLDGGGIRRLLRDLTDRYLLLLDKRELDRAYTEHAMVQTFYYDSLSHRQRRAMHRLAAEYYELEDPDPFKTALHYFHAGEYERAAQFAVTDVWALINRGQARALQNLLANFKPRQVEKETWARVNLALGEVCGFFHEFQQAEESYQIALDTAQTLPVDGDALELQAKICGGISDLHRDTLPQTAIDWLEQGLGVLPEGQSEIKADLLLKLSTLQFHSGDYRPALDTIEQALASLPEADSWLRLGVWINRGLIYWKLGNLAEAIASTEKGLPIVQALRNYFREVLLWNNLGIYKDEIGDWPGAVEMYRHALNLSKKLNNVRYQMILGSNMAFLLTKMGQFEEARQRYSKSLQLANDLDLKIMTAQFQSNVADLFLRQGDLSSAAAALTEADDLAAKLNFNEERPAIDRGWAQLYLLRQKADQALSYAEKGVAAAQTMETPLEEGASQRVLAMALWANNQPEAALQAFAQSLDLLEGGDPYEAARTQSEWGRCLLTGSDPDRGRILLQNARETFAQLGAQRDLALVEELLAA